MTIFRVTISVLIEDARYITNYLKYIQIYLCDFKLCKIIVKYCVRSTNIQNVSTEDGQLRPKHVEST
jgi:hypothetical protein